MKLAVFPARGGSRRIKGKNIINFMGQPMITHALHAARESRLFDRIHVSTESREIAKVVEQFGVAVDFMRAPELADDATPLLPVLQWVLREFDKRGERFDTIALVMPCAPLIEARDLVEAHDVFVRHDGRRPVMAVAPYSAPIEWAYRRREDGSLTPVSPGAFAIRSQDISKAYHDSGTFYFFARQHILGPDPVTDGDYVSFVLPRTKAVDIDDAEDLELAKTLFAARRAQGA